MEQVHNQEFARAGEISQNQGALINMSSTTQERKVLQGKPKTFPLFPKSGNFFPVFEKGQRQRPHLLLIKNCRILMLTKFTILKLKSDAFSVSMIFLEGALCWKFVSCFLCRALFIQSRIIKRKCKTTFSTVQDHETENRCLQCFPDIYFNKSVASFIQCSVYRPAQ